MKKLHFQIASWVLYATGLGFMWYIYDWKFTLLSFIIMIAHGFEEKARELN